MASQPFLDAVAARRSIYNLTKTLPQSTTESRILEIVKHALAYAPSPFNMRSCRCIVLFGEEHERLWQEGYRVTAEGPHGGAAIQVLGPKIKAFEAGAGTVLFFDDQTAYESLTPRFSAIAKQFPEWEEHSSGMHQFIVWTALEAEDLGCNLQHYQPGITPYVREQYGVPESWKLKCQLVFGGRVEGEVLEEKAKTRLESSLKVFGV